MVAAVHGMAAGGAQYFLNESDIIIAADDAAFFDPHANGGIVSALEPIGMLAARRAARRRAALGADGHRGTDNRGDRAAARPGHRSRATRRVARTRRARSRPRSPRAIRSRSRAPFRAIWESLDMTRSMALQERNGVHPHRQPARPSDRSPGATTRRRMAADAARTTSQLVSVDDHVIEHAQCLARPPAREVRRCRATRGRGRRRSPDVEVRRPAATRRSG